MKTKYQYVLDELLSDIQSGKYSAGGFPSENMAARRFGIGRKTAAKVFDELVRRGLLVRRRGSGTFLSPRAKHSFGRVGLIIHGSDYCEVFAPVSRAISRLCQQRGISLVFADLSGDIVGRRIERVAETAAEFVRTGVDGVIFQPVELVKKADEINRRILSVFDEADVPVVLLDSDIVQSPDRSAYDLAAVNHFEAGRRLGEHLVRQGAKRIAYIMEPDHAPCVQSRFLGVKVAAEGYTVPDTAVYANPESITSVRRIMKQLAPDAFACYNDRMARLLSTTLSKLGYSIPRDILLAGFDDVNFATIASPELTTLRQPCDELASLAFEMLTTRINNHDLAPRETFLDAKLVIRESTGL